MEGPFCEENLRSLEERQIYGPVPTSPRNNRTYEERPQLRSLRGLVFLFEDIGDIGDIGVNAAVITTVAYATIFAALFRVAAGIATFWQ